MTRHVGEVEAPPSVVEREGVDEVAAQEGGRHELAAELERAEVLVVARQQAELDQSAGLLVVREEPKRRSKLAVDRFEVVA